jgi:hypothetical protein
MPGRKVKECFGQLVGSRILRISAAAVTTATEVTPDMRKTLWSSVVLVILAMAGGWYIYGVDSVDPNSLTLLTNSPKTYAPPVNITPTATSNCTSKCIAMEYEMWFPGIDDNRTTSLWTSRWGTPLLGTYISADPNIIDRHAEWFTDLGVDFLIVDWSNSSQNHVAGDTSVDTNTRANTDALFAEYEKLSEEGKSHPRIVILTGAFDEGPVKQQQVISSGALQDEVNYIYQQYVHKYPDICFSLDGKPLLLVDTLFNGDPGWRDSRFSVRLMSATLESQYAIYTNSSSNTFWSWYDRDPIPSHNNGAVESVTVTQAYPGNVGWTDTSSQPSWDPRPAQGRSGIGRQSTFSMQWNKAVSYNPQIIILNQWNEFQGGNAPSDDQYTPELSNDIEPTVELGCAPMEAVQRAVVKWKRREALIAPRLCH